MGIPTGDGPDLIINRMREQVAVPWTLPIAIIIGVIWLLVVAMPFVVAEERSVGGLVRWSTVALVALALTFVVAALARQERTGAILGALATGAAVIAVVWVVT